jgi:hypothetical protein
MMAWGAPAAEGSTFGGISLVAAVLDGRAVSGSEKVRAPSVGPALAPATAALGTSPGLT